MKTLVNHTLGGRISTQRTLNNREYQSQMMIRMYVVSTMIAMISLQSLAAEITGRAVDDIGTALQKVTLCLGLADSPGDCIKVKSTNIHGDYSFKGVKAPQTYTVAVLPSNSASERKRDTYANHVWEPSTLRVEIQSKSTVASGIDFKGTFSYSNFQKSCTLTAADFPELGYFDPLNDYVFLKIYTTDARGEQNLIYLGQVTNLESLALIVSVPLATSELHYEIFNVADTLTNVISLATS